jgi:hypothetical protein
MVTLRTMQNWLRPLILITLGLISGGGLGLYLGWVAWPTEYTQADPQILQDRYRQDYTVMIAAAYSLDGDLAAARQRLNNVAGAESNAWLLRLTVDTILAGGNDTEIRHLVLLTSDLGLYSPVMAPYLGAGGEP